MADPPVWQSLSYEHLTKFIAEAAPAVVTTLVETRFKVVLTAEGKSRMAPARSDGKQTPVDDAVAVAAATPFLY